MASQLRQQNDYDRELRFLLCVCVCVAFVLVLVSVQAWVSLFDVRTHVSLRVDIWFCKNAFVCLCLHVCGDKAEDVCVCGHLCMCVFDTSTFIFSLLTGRLGTSVAHAHGRLGLDLQDPYSEETCMGGSFLSACESCHLKAEVLSVFSDHEDLTK